MLHDSIVSEESPEDEKGKIISLYITECFSLIRWEALLEEAACLFLSYVH